MKKRWWLCVETYQASGRPSRFWTESGEQSPDAPVLYDGQEFTPYPFNGMGGRVVDAYGSKAEAMAAADELILVDEQGFVQWRPSRRTCPNCHKW